MNFAAEYNPQVLKGKFNCNCKLILFIYSWHFGVYKQHWLIFFTHSNSSKLGKTLHKSRNHIGLFVVIVAYNFFQNYCTFCPHSLLNMSQISGVIIPDLPKFGLEKNPVKSSLPLSLSVSSPRMYLSSLP